MYPVIPSPTSAGAVHEMAISFVETESVVGEDGRPGKPNKNTYQ